MAQLFLIILSTQFLLSADISLFVVDVCCFRSCLLTWLITMKALGDIFLIFRKNFSKMYLNISQYWNNRIGFANPCGTCLNVCLILG